MTSPVEIQAELELAATQLDASSTKLAQLMKEAEVTVPVDGDGVVGKPIRGPAMRYRIALESALIEIYEKALADDKRPPAEDIRQALAEKQVREGLPDLWAEHYRIKTEMSALQMFISARKQSISARQSVLRGERG